MTAPQRKWGGDLVFLIENLVMKDFRIRYRNMSLGILWSLVNPLVMMGVLTFVFGHLSDNARSPQYPLFVLCGLVPYNFFVGAMLGGTSSIVDSAHLVKRVPVPREVVPLSAVFSCCIHLSIQLALLLGFSVYFRLLPGKSWLWLPVIWILYIVFLSGLALGASAINVFLRDTRYVVESFNLVLFWLVPIYYPFSFIPAKYQLIYNSNPVAAVVLAMQRILIDRQPPPASLIIKLTIAAALAMSLGLLIFGRLKSRFYEHI